MLMLMSMSFESFEVNLEATVMRLNSLAVCLLLVHSFLDQISANDNFHYQIGDIFRPYESPLTGPVENNILSIDTVAENPVEDTSGYTGFEAYCNATVVKKRPFTSVTVCANHCDKMLKCVGFQITNNQCLLLQQRCRVEDLKTVKSSHLAAYYLQEFHCLQSSECQSDKSCWAPKGFNCACEHGYCYPEISETKIPFYHHYRTISPPSYKRMPLISLARCSSECLKDSMCTSFSIDRRFCAFHKVVRPPSNAESDNDVLNYFVKDIFANLTCQNDSDCLEASNTWCHEVECVCSSNHNCVDNGSSQPLGAAGLALIFTERLKKHDPIRANNPPTECTDKHICCSELFKTPGECSDADFNTCPKSCGQCHSTTGCKDFSTLCENNKVLCDHSDFGPYMRSQCPQTCGYCEKSPKDIGFVCKACKDDQPNCEDLANEGQCDQIKEKCRKSCGCF